MSILSDFSLSWSTPVLLKIEEYQSKGGRETKQEPVGLLVVEDFLCPLFLVCRIEASASTAFPEFQGQFQTVANQVREGMQKQGRSTNEQ